MLNDTPRLASGKRFRDHSRLIPLMGCGYFVQFPDKAVLGQAALFNLLDELVRGFGASNYRVTGKRYAFSSTFSICYSGYFF